MRQPNSKRPDLLLWVGERAFTLFIVVAISVIVGVFIIGYYLQKRLDKIEGRLHQAPSRSYVAPDLAALAAKPIPAAEVAVSHSVYVPVYSHVYYLKGRPYQLETTLSIRNTDLSRPVYVRAVRYYDTSGKLVRSPIDQLIRLNPLQTLELLVERRDTSGGSGANFIVEWLATEEVDPPMIEAVMVGAAGSHGLSFRTVGQTLLYVPKP